jgi:hypothetical protein
MIHSKNIFGSGDVEYMIHVGFSLGKMNSPDI